MLTEIEWWGGIIFIWWAFSYWFVFKEWTVEMSVSFISMNLSYILSAFVLALYFYPLESIDIKYAYLIVLAIAIVSILLMFFWPDTNKSLEEEGKNESDDSELNDDDSSDELIGQVFLFSPMVIGCLLALFKSLDLIKEIGLI